MTLPILLPNINKIIYLDGDTITLIGLKEMYDIDMDNYYYKGFLDYLKDSFNPNNNLYLCSGVLLINLEELRKDDMVNKTYKFLNDNKAKLLYYKDKNSFQLNIKLTLSFVYIYKIYPSSEYIDK